MCDVSTQDSPPGPQRPPAPLILHRRPGGRPPDLVGPQCRTGRGVPVGESQRCDRPRGGRLHDGLSKQIGSLEQQLHAPLFLRGPGGVTLTAAGRALLPHARRVVAAWDEAQTAVVEAITADTRSLVVGLTISVGRGLIPATLRGFHERHPDWQVDLRQAGFGEAIVHDRAGSADVAFCWLPLPDSRGLDHRVLLTEPRHVALPVDHPLVGQDVVDFGQLLVEPFLALPESAGPQRAFWLGTDARGGMPPRVAAVVWRQGDHRAAVRDFVDSCLHAAEEVRDQAASPAC